MLNSWAVYKGYTTFQPIHAIYSALTSYVVAVIKSKHMRILYQQINCSATNVWFLGLKDDGQFLNKQYTFYLCESIIVFVVISQVVMPDKIIFSRLLVFLSDTHFGFTCGIAVRRVRIWFRRETLDEGILLFNR